MKQKLTFGILLLLASVLAPACKHEHIDSKTLYLKYLQNHIKK